MDTRKPRIPGKKIYQKTKDTGKPRIPGKEKYTGKPRILGNQGYREKIPENQGYWET